MNRRLIVLGFLFLVVLGLAWIVGKERMREARESFYRMPIVHVNNELVVDLERRLGPGATRQFGSVELWAKVIGSKLVVGQVVAGRLIQPTQIGTNSASDVSWGFSTGLSSYLNRKPLEEVVNGLGEGELIEKGDSAFWLYELDKGFWVLGRVEDGTVYQHSHGLGGRESALNSIQRAARP